MRAYLLEKYGDLDFVKLREVTRPAPSAGELLVEVFAAGLNPSDVKVISGSFAGRTLHAGNFPMPIGFDFSGVVISVGEGVTSRKPGDEVFGFLPYSRKNRAGTFADSVCVDAGTVGRKPTSISHAQAAGAATPGITALQALRKHGNVKEGQSVLVNGASGGVGSYAVQIAKLLGAQVSGTASAAKAELVKSLGASDVYDYNSTAIPQIPGTFDVIFDVAANAAYASCAKRIKAGGAFITLVPSASFVLGKLITLFGSKRCVFMMVQPVAADLEQLSAWFEEGKLKPILDETVPFAGLKGALELVRAGKVRSKIAVSMKD
jgi:NADPH:quinone reductase-like Zn-dependent oxidoreductase